MSSFFSLPWSRPHCVNQPGTATASLPTLPSDLLFMIADELPLPDAANFALVNRRLSMLVGPRRTCWPRLRIGVEPPEQRERFLRTFARDLPSWFYCHSRSHLHRLDRIRSPLLFDEPSNAEGRGETYIYYRILYHHVQLVMQRCYLGLGYGISTDDLSFVQLHEFGENKLKGRRTTLLSVEARVCTEPARLCLRVQRWTVLHTNILELAVERAKCAWLCMHNNAERGEFSQLIPSSLEECFTRSERAREPKRRICRRCQYVYQLEVLDTGGYGLAIVTTKWVDLGPWLIPLSHIPRWRFDNMTGDRTDLASDAERCRVKFDREEGLNQPAITFRSASYLGRRRYREAMNEIFAGVWISEAGRVRTMFDLPLALTLSGLWRVVLFCAIFSYSTPSWL